MEDTLYCLECGKELEPPFETQRLLCHICNVKEKEKKEDDSQTTRLM